MDFESALERYAPDGDMLKDRDDGLAGQPSAPSARLPVEARCDLHGMTADEARRAVDRFLKDAASRGLRKVLVIHGKGSGTLRQAVCTYLEGHPLAGRREVAPRQEGGSGALVVFVRQKKQAP